MKTKLSLLLLPYLLTLGVLPVQAQTYGSYGYPPPVYYPPVYWGKTLIFPEVNTYPSSAQIITVVPSYPLGYSVLPPALPPGLNQAPHTHNGNSILQSLLGTVPQTNIAKQTGARPR